MAPKRNGNRRGRSGNGPNNSAFDMAVDSQAAGPEGTVQVEISNWQGASADDAVQFLARKTNVRLNNVNVRGALLTGTVGAKEGLIMRKWSGVRFAGKPLSIFVRDQQPSANATATINILVEFLARRFNPQSQWLNLNDLRNDEFLRQNNLPYTSPTTSSKMFTALMRVAAERLPNVTTVSLESNELTNVEPVIELAVTYPHLQNLSLANNRISRPSQLAPWSYKLPFLREIVLTGNPVSSGPQNLQYEQQIVKTFPRLMIYNGKPVRTEAELPPWRLPVPIKPTFFETESVQQLAMSFLGNFFQLWDTNRDALLPLYDAVSEFSVCMNSATPRKAGAPSLAHSQMTTVSRNLAKSSSVQTRQNRLALGPSAVAAVFHRLPQSRHDLSRAENYAIDAWQLHDVRSQGDTAVLIRIHGMYTELPGNVDRSFDRTFVVLPAPNGSMIVASDMLTIRPLSILPFPEAPLISPEGVPAAINGIQPPIPGQSITPAETPTPLAQTGSPAPSVPLDHMGMGAPITPMNGPNIAQQEVLQALMAQTRLNAEYAELCAKQANYDLRTALDLFDQSRAQLPPNAFQ